MADTNLGRVGFVPKGLHNSGAPYDILDTVVYAKNGYCCIKPVPVDSGILPTNTEYFVLLVEKGEQGNPGPGGTGPKGDTFTYDDLTTAQLEEITAGIEGFTTHINPFETKVGVISLFGVDYDLYRSIAEIANIPTTLNAEATYILAEIPLGFNLYLKTDSLVVAQEPGSATTDFFNDSYKISRLFVDSDLSTKVTIKCIQEVAVAVKATIQVEYVKGFGDMVEFTVTVPAGVNPANVNLTFPKLKYNKAGVASLTVDDSYSIWNNIFSVINKRWVDNELCSYFWPSDAREFFYHKGLEVNVNGVLYKKSNGYIPEKPLEYSDGAGIKHRFAASVGAWVWKFGAENYSGGMFWPWVSAVEARFMQDFGITFNYHDILGVDEYAAAHRTTDVPQNLFNDYVKADADNFKLLTGRVPKVMQGPNGDPNYIYKSRLCPTIQYNMEIANRGTDSECTPFLPFNNTHLLNKKSEKYLVQRSFFGGSLTWETWAAEVIAQTTEAEATRKWSIMGIHRPSRELGAYGVISCLNAIEAAVGASGNDSVWFASIDEVYEYWFMTHYAQFSKSITGQDITFKVYAPSNENFWFKSISCLLSGISSLTGIAVTSSANCNGTSFAVSGTSLLVNLDFNNDLVEKAEKYLTICEDNPTADYAYEDAQYFIQKLKPGVIESYTARLSALVSPPALSLVRLNNGDTTATTRSIMVTVTVVGISSHIMISENSSFAGATWSPFATSTPFTLSTGFGVKTVYVQVKNIYGESSAQSDTIDYIDVPLTLSAVSMNNGAASATNNSVVISFSYGGSALEYMLSESPDFTGASWIAFTSNPTFALSSALGVKTLYAKLKNATTTTGVVQDSIELVDANSISLTSIVINSGDAQTSSPTVSLVLNIIGSATQFRVGETADLSAIAWTTLPGESISVNLSSGVGVKTLYAQVRNATNISSVASDSIEFIEVPLRTILIANVAASGVVEGIGYVNIGSDTNTQARVIKDTGGVDFATITGTYYPNFTSDINAFRTKFGTTGESQGNPAYYTVPTLSGEGDYPNALINNAAKSAHFFLAAASLLPETRISGYYIKGVPNGTYRVRLLVSAGTIGGIGKGNYPYYRVQNEEQQGVPANILNNNTIWHVFNDVVVDDGKLLISAVNRPPAAGSDDAKYITPPIVITEIKKIS